ncbi:FHA domain-containing protein [Hoeflea sp. AS16]|uniref:FHA domain-containing protein n=1 Tax=Hoeflea sp. AS16 TaxID=3135779 RepID=UPI003179CE8D
MALATELAGYGSPQKLHLCRAMFRQGRSLGTALALTAATLLFGLGARTHATELLMDCAEDKVAQSATVACDFRFTEPQQLEELTLSANGQAIVGSSFSPYPGTGEKSAWLYLIDRSNPRRAATVQRNVDIAGQQLQTASGSRLIGLATFANDIEVVLEPASRHPNLDATLATVKADGAATELFANSLKAIDILKTVPADRKALVIMSDGKAEDTAYTRQDVVDAARSAGVIIIGLGFAESNSETPALQELRRLAEETGGYFDAVVGSQAFASDFAGKLPRYLENGGTIRGPVGDASGDVAIELSAKVAGGASYDATQKVAIEAAPLPEPPKPLSTVASIYASMLGEGSDTVTWADNNQVLAWLLLAILPVLIIAGLGFWLSKKNRDTVDAFEEVDLDDAETLSTMRTEALEGNFEDEATRFVSAANTDSFGYFEIVGSEDRPFAITAHSISIGRHSDNDFVLSNDSVHRHHAHFHISPDGVPTINDLDTTNGVVINGSRVDRADLQSGDLIELGEVRLRYVAG